MLENSVSSTVLSAYRQKHVMHPKKEKDKHKKLYPVQAGKGFVSSRNHGLLTELVLAAPHGCKHVSSPATTAWQNMTCDIRVRHI